MVDKEVMGLMDRPDRRAPSSGSAVVTELKNRGVQDIFIACVDGLKGFPEAIETVYPQGHCPALYRPHGAQ